MLKRFGVIFGAALMIGGGASADTLLLDFGNSQGGTNRTRQHIAGAADNPVGKTATSDDRFYNEIANATSLTPLSLVTSTGAATASTYVLVDVWRNFADDGNPNHYENVPHLYPNTVAKDNGIEVTLGNGLPDDDNTVGFNITGLNPLTQYRLTFFGSNYSLDPLSDNVGGGTFSKYTATGLISQSVTEHTNGNFLHTVFVDALPALDGTIRIDMTPDLAAYLAFYGHTANEYQGRLNVLEITPTAEAIPEPAGLGLLAVAALGVPRRSRLRS